MSNVANRILVVGPPSPHTRAVLARLLQRGHGSHDAVTLREAASVLETFRFDIVLAPETLPDGSGYHLATQVAAQSGSLVVSVELSETCLWLPVVVRGSRVLGERALNMTTLEWDLEEMLTSHAAEYGKAVAMKHKAVQAAGSREAPSAGRRRAAGVARNTVRDTAREIS